MKYKVVFNGFAYVEAEDETEAIEKVEDGLSIYSEYESVAEEVDEFTVVI